MYTNDQKREIEAKAQNTVGLKDYGTKGRDKNGNDKDGFYTLKDNRTIKLSELEPGDDAPEFDFDIEQAIKDFPDLKDHKGFGIDSKTNKARSGFYVSSSEKVVSVKRLKEAMTKAAANQNVN